MRPNSQISDTKIPLLPTQHGGIDTAVSHPCLSNLVVYTEDWGEEPFINETIAQFVVKHPCRVILIMAQPRHAISKLETNLFAHTYGNEAGKNVLCEQITLKATGASVKELASAVQPLLTPDLPIYLWWRGVFLHQRVLVEQMLQFADRFIYDGVGWSNLHYTVLQVADCIEKHDEKVGFTNFNWSRLRPWRENTADFFDHGLFEKEVWELNRVRVEYMALPGNEEGYQYRALLYIAWLAVQLEWEAVRGTPGIDLAMLQFTNKQGGIVDAELAMLPQSSEAGQSIQRVILGVNNSAGAVEFTVERDHKEHLMVLKVTREGKTSVLRKVPHADSTAADLLYRELGRRVRNRVFENTFKMAANILQLI
jgi:glucose-6-phosphate dehydrogenase assembly protein OpcA